MYCYTCNFHTRDDDDAIEEIKSLPGQVRYGVNRIEEFLKPILDHGLQSVLVFGVPSKLPKVIKRSIFC